MTAIVLAVLGAAGLVVARIAWYYPDNHVGFDPWWIGGAVSLGAWVLVIALWTCGWMVSRGMLAALAAATVLLALVVLAADRCNLLVSYDTWTTRGMPGPFQSRGAGP